ncbi:PqqD family protein [Candidatus Accumulibacter sp. ACC003]|uniref:PqqD family protein n=1 Tax=Candidatus Accumulibacter sp. ACC003 TaxID=2823334 RepID=UPI0025C4044E|nr:PqqD family protein [Candidatus Accumulibacter sp. ACC003]
MILNANGYTFDTRTGRSYSVNPPGMIALLIMQDGKSRRAMIDALVAACQQPRAVVEAGVDDFIQQLTRCVS